MAVATMQVHGAVGPTPTEAILPTGPPRLRFKDADNNTVDSNDPIPIPGAGTYYSRWKHIFLYCSAINDATQIDNVKFYTSGSLNWGTGVDVQVGNQTPTHNSGSTAGYDESDTDNQELVANHANITTKANVNTKTSGSPLSVSISEASNIIDATGESSDYIVLQMDVGSTASPGDISDQTLTIQYDEI